MRSVTTNGGERTGWPRMTASTITWDELVNQSQMTGQLALVIPTGSAPLAGLFVPVPKHEISFALACFNRDPMRRAQAAAAALLSSRYHLGLDE